MMARRTCITLFALGCAVALAGFLGALHPAGDSFAVLRPLCILGFLVLATFAWRSGIRRIAAMSLLIAIGLSASILAAALPRTGSGTAEITLYQKNMLFGRPTTTGMEADIRAANPDVVTLQEVSRGNARLIAALADLYPTRLDCAFGVAVLTRLPRTETEPVCLRSHRLAALEVIGPSGPIWVASVHLNWPWPYRQARQATNLKNWLETRTTPVILAGDFNMIPWSHRMASLARAANGTRAGPVRITYSVNLRGWHFYPMPIDHVIAPKGGHITQRPRAEADHFGLLARLPM